MKYSYHAFLSTRAYRCDYRRISATASAIASENRGEYLPEYGFTHESGYVYPGAS